LEDDPMQSPMVNLMLTPEGDYDAAMYELTERGEYSRFATMTFVDLYSAAQIFRRSGVERVNIRVSPLHATSQAEFARTELARHGYNGRVIVHLTSHNEQNERLLRYEAASRRLRTVNLNDLHTDDLLGLAMDVDRGWVNDEGPSIERAALIKFLSDFSYNNLN
jgi:hypothetical protein